MSGLEVTAAAYVDRCSIDYTICTDEVEFRLADRHEIFHLTATETGLEALARLSSAALRELRLRERREHRTSARDGIAPPAEQGSAQPSTGAAETGQNTHHRGLAEGPPRAEGPP